MLFIVNGFFIWNLGWNCDAWFRNIFYWLFSKRILDDKEYLNDIVQIAVENPYRQSKIAFANQVEAIEKFNCV